MLKSCLLIRAQVGDGIDGMSLADVTDAVQLVQYWHSHFLKNNGLLLLGEEFV